MRKATSTASRAFRPAEAPPAPWPAYDAGAAGPPLPAFSFSLAMSLSIVPFVRNSLNCIR